MIWVDALSAAASTVTEAAAATVPLWEQWLSPAGVESIVKNGGLVLLAYLFFTGRIITEKQHLARVADALNAINARIEDLIANHARELAQKDVTYGAMVTEKDSAYSEMKESRDYYRGARLEEKDRADRATEQLLESSEIARTATHALVALGEAAGGGKKP